MAFELCLDIGDLTRQEREVPLGAPIYDFSGAMVGPVRVLRLPLDLDQEEWERRRQEWLRRGHEEKEERLKKLLEAK